MLARLRLLTMDDLAEVTELTRRNRDFLAPWEPDRGERWFDEPAQRADLRAKLDDAEAGRGYPFAICDDSDVIVGRLNLTGVTRGAFQSASVGYWVSEEAGGRGLATGAVHEAMRHSFTVLGLHRLEAGTLLHNVPSQTVLQRAGFQPFAVAPKHVKIAGRWQDHLLFATFADD